MLFSFPGCLKLEMRFLGISAVERKHGLWIASEPTWAALGCQQEGLTHLSLVLDVFEECWVRAVSPGDSPCTPVSRFSWWDPPHCPAGSGSSWGPGQGHPLGGAADGAGSPPPFQPLIQLFRASLQPPALQACLCHPTSGVAADAVSPGSLRCRCVETATGFPHLAGAHPEQNRRHMQN